MKRDLLWMRSQVRHGSRRLLGFELWTEWKLEKAIMGMALRGIDHLMRSWRTRRQGWTA
jgi:hypothetical protein